MEIKKTTNYAVGTIPKIGFIIHGTLGNYAGAVDWLYQPCKNRNPVTYSSAHYVIAKNGDCTQLVSNSDVAWHAGSIVNPTEYAKSVLPKTILGTFKNPNESFIGIELEWFVGDTVTEEQYKKIWEIILSSSIVSPIILSHREITDYKSDFIKADKSIDYTVVERLRKQVSDFWSPSTPIVSREDKKAAIIKLIQEL